jgi:hypothetical protein
VELYGVGFRHGFTTAAISVAMPEPGPPVFEESELFGVPGPPRSESRNVYASDYAVGSARDVSNHVRQGFDPTPWAIGSVAGMMPGSAVPINATLEFEIDLTIPAVIEQLQAGLDQGSLFFSVASKHASVQGSSEGIPSFHLVDAAGGSVGQRAHLHLDYALVPEPSATTLLVLTMLIWPPLRRHLN